MPDLPELTASQATVDQGRILYGARCSWCHGYAAIGNGTVPDLRYANAATHEAWTSIVLDGAYESRGMPVFGEVLTEEEALAIRAYILSEAHALQASGD